MILPENPCTWTENCYGSTLYCSIGLSLYIRTILEGKQDVIFPGRPTTQFDLCRSVGLVDSILKSVDGRGWFLLLGNQGVRDW